MNSIEFQELTKKKIRLLRKYDHKMGRAFKQGKLNLVEYWATRISTTLELFGPTKQNKSYCNHWLRIHKLMRNYDSPDFEEGDLKLRKIALPSSSFQEMIFPLVLYCCQCYHPFTEGFETTDKGIVFCSINCAKAKEDQDQ